MKTFRFFVAMAMVLLAANSADAQNTMRIHHKDGSRQDVSVASVDYIEWVEKIEGLPTTPVFEEVEINGKTYNLGISGAIDLGLGTRWAAYNIGAETPAECGEYYAWGETETKLEFNWNTYKYMQEGFADNYHVTKYTTDDYEMDGCWYNDDTYVGTTVDGVTYKNKIQLDEDDDVVHQKWQGDWRMPTSAEQDDLCYNCTWIWGQYGGQKGYFVVGSTGNCIFIPAAGYYADGKLNNSGWEGYYWSSSLRIDNSYNSYHIGFSVSNVYWQSDLRYNGFSVRAVVNYR